MARLPQPGSDAGKWGEILNEYLGVAHGTDGTLKVDSVGAPQLKPNSVTNAALAPNAVTKESVGLGSVDNTSDANKPISAATATALNQKLDAADAVKKVYGKTPINGEITYSDSDLAYYAANPDALFLGTLSLDEHGAVVGAAVRWPDGTQGEYSSIAVSSQFPGAVDAYEVTYGQYKKLRQPSVTRDAQSGRVINRPAIIAEVLS